jgi:hypothetical protein
MLVGSVVDDVALIDVASAAELFAARTDVDVALLVEHKVRSAEGAIVASRLVPHRNMWRDLAIQQPPEHPNRAINTVACEPLGPKVEAAFDAVDHGLGDDNLGGTVSARALGIDDDPSLVVDEIVCIVSKEWVGALPCDPCRLWIGQRDFFRRAASTAATARIAVVSAATLLITAGGIEDREVLANRTGCLLGLRPGDRLIAGQPLLLGSVCPDQARYWRRL